MEWIDNVLPLLKYDQNHYDDFYYHAQYVRITSLSADTLMAHLNHMIGIVSQAVTELENNISSPVEIVPVHNPAENPPNEKIKNTGENQNSLNIWQRPIGATWLVAAGGTLVLMVGYIFRHYLGIPL